MAKKLLRLDETLAADIKHIATEQRCSENQVYNDALALYRDYCYSKGKARFINDELLNILQASYKMAENGINYKTNKLLSELAIQSCIQNFILAQSLEISQSDLNRFRLRAVEFLKTSQRVFRMDEAVEE